ncbi:MAG: carbohydrate kinase family protein [Chloroflexota bacterium]|nr:MAG: carbohydrate kinase [Bellilinea sp.]
MDVDSLNPEKRVLVIGAASLDVLGQPIGMPEPGTSNPSHVRTSFGGVARNVAENLARLGQPVSLVSAVGKDDLGAQLLHHTASAGVDVSHCLQVSDASTAAYIAILDEKGNLYYGLDDMSILRHVSSSYLRSLADLFARSALVFVDANLAPATLRTVFSLAKRFNIPVCADATSTPLAKRLETHLSRLFLLNANRSEASTLLDNRIEVNDMTSALAAAREFVRLGVEIAVIPMGEGGVCYATSQTSGHIPAVLTRIVDSIGAGDALTATTLFGILNDMDIDEAIRLGVTAASLTLTHPGAVVPNLSLELLYDRLII